MYLSYSGYDVAKKCLFLYWHRYINHTPHEKEDGLGAAYGKIVGRLFENFYSQEMWRRPGSRQALLDQAEKITDEELKDILTPRPEKNRPGGLLLWQGEGEGRNPHGLYTSREDLLQDVKAAIPRGLDTIKTHRLLGKNAKAELKLDSDVGGHRLAGRADFVMTRIAPHRDLVILDGKGSRRRDRHVNPTQLQWYSMLFLEKYGRLPDGTAFVYWHFDPPSNIDWCTVTRADVDELRDTVLRFISKVDALQKASSGKSLPVVRNHFKPKASAFNCRFCPYSIKEICPKGHEAVQEIEERAAR